MKIINNINFNGKQLKNAVVDKLSAAPSTPIEGQIYFNDGSVTANDIGFYIRQGSSWKKLTDQSMSASDILTALKTVDTDTSGLNADTLDSQQGSWYQDRANHSGTQLASTISDFDTQVRTSRLDQLAVPTASVSLNSQKIISLATPTDGTDAANKAYVDGLVQGLDIKGSVRVATVSSFNITNYTSGVIETGQDAFTLSPHFDGVAVDLNDRVLVKDRITATQNGFYKVTQASPTVQLTRVDLLEGQSINSNAFVFVEQGATLADTGWVVSTNSGTVGTVAIAFVQFSSAGIITANPANGVVKTGNDLSINTSIVARKQVGAVPFGSTTASISHSLATSDISVSVREVSTGELVLADVVITGTGGFNLIFDTAPTENQYRYILIG